MSEALLYQHPHRSCLLLSSGQRMRKTPKRKREKEGKVKKRGKRTRREQEKEGKEQKRENIERGEREKERKITKKHVFPTNRLGFSLVGFPYQDGKEKRKRKQGIHTPRHGEPQRPPPD